MNKILGLGSVALMLAAAIVIANFKFGCNKEITTPRFTQVSLYYVARDYNYECDRCPDHIYMTPTATRTPITPTRTPFRIPTATPTTTPTPDIRNYEGEEDTYDPPQGIFLREAGIRIMFKNGNMQYFPDSLGYYVKKGKRILFYSDRCSGGRCWFNSEDIVWIQAPRRFE